ncbi:hypothetical protein O71_11249 [Pontibacter sp. BAB1700]|nr:DUF2391 family protein [Pontibacter sp. BAB1700]EJF10080.1 hypothetical protein O71_11249 [Pontibacter sp. BAB1700]
MKKRPVRKSLQEYARGIAGGLLFSFPLLFTMEVWWAGFIATPFQLLIMVVVTYLLLLGYNRYAGMRPGASWRSVFIDSVEEMGWDHSVLCCAVRAQPHTIRGDVH